MVALQKNKVALQNKMALQKNAQMTDLLQSSLRIIHKTSTVLVMKMFSKA